MDKFEEEVQYFIDLVKNNVRVLTRDKLEGISKEEMIFFNWNMSKDAQEIVVYNQKKDLIYEMPTKKIKDFDFQKVNKDEVLNLIMLLKLYSNQQITLKNFIRQYEQVEEGKG